MVYVLIMNFRLLSLLHKLVILFFPPFCVCCKENGAVLCDECYQLIHFNLQPISSNLINQDHLDQVLILAVYQPPISQLIKALKYQHTKEAGKMLAQLLFLHIIFPEFDLITNAPISKKRLNERGFNQAQLIAERLAKILNKPSGQLLKKIKDTKKQAQSNFQQRLSNLSGCFQVESQYRDFIKDKTILIVDDVISTGSTLNECAKTLKISGAKRIIGVALAQSL